MINDVTSSVRKSTSSDTVITEKTASGELDSCAICLAPKDIEEGNLAKLEPCLHSYHAYCAASWLIRFRNDACPSCRSPVTRISQLGDIGECSEPAAGVSVPDDRVNIHRLLDDGEAALPARWYLNMDQRSQEQGQEQEQVQVMPPVSRLSELRVRARDRKWLLAFAAQSLVRMAASTSVGVLSSVFLSSSDKKNLTPGTLALGSLIGSSLTALPLTFLKESLPQSWYMAGLTAVGAEPVQAMIGNLILNPRNAKPFHVAISSMLSETALLTVGSLSVGIGVILCL